MHKIYIFSWSKFEDCVHVDNSGTHLLSFFPPKQLLYEVTGVSYKLHKLVRVLTFEEIFENRVLKSLKFCELLAA